MLTRNLLHVDTSRFLKPRVTGVVRADAQQVPSDPRELILISTVLFFVRTVDA